MKLEYIVGAIAILFVAQFFYGLAVNPGSEFEGADGAAEDVISGIDPDYEPWDPVSLSSSRLAGN